ncbi:hypothetical protein I552_0400 [Mycobacterium xenopi 3993]|nr:hypothetical protein I552_0400 [Mycobacterium xenopi 3993]
MTLSPSAGIWTEKAIFVDSSIDRASAWLDLRLTTPSSTVVHPTDVETILSLRAVGIQPGRNAA